MPPLPDPPYPSTPSKFDGRCGLRRYRWTDDSVVARHCKAHLSIYNVSDKVREYKARWKQNTDPIDPHSAKLVENYKRGKRDVGHVRQTLF